MLSDENPKWIVGKRITDWFDCLNLDHLRAYRTLQEKGDWPDGFLPDGIVLEPSWYVAIAHKLAGFWIAASLRKPDDREYDRVRLTLIERDAEIAALKGKLCGEDEMVKLFTLFFRELALERRELEAQLSALRTQQEQQKE